MRTRRHGLGVVVILVLGASSVSAQPLSMPTPVVPEDRVGPRPLSEPVAPLPGLDTMLPPQPWSPQNPAAAPPTLPTWRFAPPPGWFLSLDAAFLRPSVWSDALTDDYGPLNPELRRTFAPTGTVGYRFDCGASVLLSYRYLAASATTVFPPSSPPPPGDQAPPYPPSGPVQSRFASNWLDLDYRSPYLGGWHNFRVQWQAGLRGAQLFYQEYQVASSFQFVGAGPHAGAELSWWMGQSGLAVYARGDLGVLAGQTMSLPWCGDAAVIHAIWDWRGEVGLRYVLPTRPWMCFSGGYQGESFGWGPIGRNFTPTGPFARFEIAF